MKVALVACAAVIVFTACRKDLSVNEGSINGEILSSDALTPLPCHSASFVTNYVIKPGEVPPFRFTKTFYADTRVKTINMLSRLYPIYAGYKKHAVELTGTFTYGPNRAYLKGNSVVWEYYKTSTGAGARRSVSTAKVDLKFYINPKGYCDTVVDFTQPSESSYHEPYVLTIGKNYMNQEQILITRTGSSGGSVWAGYDFKYPLFDKYGNIISFDQSTAIGTDSYFKAEYDYNIPRGSKNYSFIPSQNLISQEYSLLEVMQWRPQPSHQRKTVAGVFRLSNNTWVEQRQSYRNYRFDAKGNQTSVTYADNVLQKTTWFCK